MLSDDACVFSCLKNIFVSQDCFSINWLVKGWVKFPNVGSGEGALGFSVLRIWPIFGVLHGLRVFFGFRFSSTMMAVVRTFLPSALYGFFDFAKEIIPRSRAQTGQ